MTACTTHTPMTDDNGTPLVFASRVESVAEQRVCNEIRVCVRCSAAYGETIPVWPDEQETAA